MCWWSIPRCRRPRWRELVAYAKANPDKLTYASVGIGGTPHLAMEMLKAAAGIEIRRIPYNRGLAPAIADTLAGQVDMVFGNLADVRTHIANGAVKALGVGSETRIAELPGVPAIAELYPGYLNVAWYAFVAPPKTPDAVVRKLSDAIAETLQRPEVAHGACASLGSRRWPSRRPRRRPSSRARPRAGARRSGTPGSRRSEIGVSLMTC